MRSLIVYESIYGNTRDVALAIAEGLSRYGTVEVREVGEAPNPADHELIVVGGPIHAWGMPSELTRKGARDEAVQHGADPVSKGIGVREWIASLPNPRPGTAAAAFDTAMHAPLGLHGSAARPEARRLAAHGYRVVGAPEHFFVKAKEGPLVDGELARARAWGESVGAEAQTGVQPTIEAISASR